MTESIYPENLLQADACPANEHARRWWVLYTKSRQEQALARELLRFRIPYFLPLVPRISRQRRRVHLLAPLFDGYVFLFGNEEERVRCLATNRVAQVVPVVDQETLYGDLRRLEELIKTGIPLAVGRPGPGNSIRVRGGSSPGVEGAVLGREVETRVVVSFDLDRGRMEMQFVED
jgi:transcriptional antiterminator RfaH